MSEYTFYLVPDDIDFIASPEQLSACEQLWKQLSPRSERECVYNHPQLMLWNPMEVTNVSCPACGSDLWVTFDHAVFKAPEHGAWWQELVFLMQSDQGSGDSAMPCCGESRTNREIFSRCLPGPVYSRFACGAHEPDLALFESDHGPLKSAHVSQFERILGRSLRHLWLGD